MVNTLLLEIIRFIHKIKIINMLDDDSKMPYGKYKGEKMENVPAGYLLWLYENNKCGEDVKQYIEDNIDVIKVEIQRRKNY